MAYPRYPDASLALNIETVRYELDRMHARVTFSPEVIHSIQAETYIDQATGQLTYQLMGLVAVWRGGRVLEVPANWWQHFKQRWFPRWALKRWPVLMEHYDAQVVLPKVPVSNPDYHTVEFPMWKRVDG